MSATRSYLAAPWEARAFLRGKTQFRVPMEPQPPAVGPTGDVFREVVPTTLAAHGFDFRYELDNPVFLSCPYPIGTRIVVKEAWRHNANRWNASNSWAVITYRADNSEREVYRLDMPSPKSAWRSASTMPQWASRISRLVIAVRPEPVREISEEDADADAFGGDFPCSVIPEMFSAEDSSSLSIPECYERLWTSRYGDRYPWESSWCWVVTVREAS